MALDGTGAIHARGLGKDGTGRGWKVSPSIQIAPGENRLLCDIEGPGALQQIWCVVSNVRWRNLILRIHWDGQEHPSVESPLGDFFGCGWNRFAQISSLAVCVNPGRAFNCYWEMPFRKRARVTLENRDPDEPVILYYQINYTLTEVPPDAAYFHAQFHRTNPLPRARLRHSRWGARQRAICRHLYGLGREQCRMVGRGRDQILYGRRR